jgi:hypothetical protein
MSAALAFQKGARLVLATESAVVELVPEDRILDTNARPEGFPRIVLGEDQEFPADDVVGRYSNVFATFHVWTQEPGLAQAKEIAGIVRTALTRLRWEKDGFRCLNTKFQSARFLRDPDGKTGHAIVTFLAVMEEIG